MVYLFMFTSNIVLNIIIFQGFIWKPNHPPETKRWRENIQRSFILVSFCEEFESRAVSNNEVANDNNTIASVLWRWQLS